jgi:hypothetical protein
MKMKLWGNKSLVNKTDTSKIGCSGYHYNWLQRGRIRTISRLSADGKEEIF